MLSGGDHWRADRTRKHPAPMVKILTHTHTEQAVSTHTTKEGARQTHNYKGDHYKESAKHAVNYKEVRGKPRGHEFSLLTSKILINQKLIK